LVSDPTAFEIVTFESVRETPTVFRADWAVA